MNIQMNQFQRIIRLGTSHPLLRTHHQYKREKQIQAMRRTPRRLAVKINASYFDISFGQIPYISTFLNIDNI